MARKDIWDTDTVHKAVNESCAFAAEAMGRRMMQHMRAALVAPGWLSVESPIEIVFWCWWEAVASEAQIPRRLIPQAETIAEGQRYRLDFALDPISQRVAVELDGHDFHERTKAQVELRNRRDRDLQRAGWRVFHFAGSEVVRDPRGCVLEVWNHAQMSSAVSAVNDAVRSEPAPPPHIESSMDGEFLRAWLAQVRREARFVYSTCLAQAKQISIIDDVIIVTFRSHLNLWDELIKSRREMMERIAFDLLGRPIQIKSEVDEASE